MEELAERFFDVLRRQHALQAEMTAACAALEDRYRRGLHAGERICVVCGQHAVYVDQSGVSWGSPPIVLPGKNKEG